jgi:excisionase family DNA binding protein
VTERLLTARELGELLGFAPATIVDWFEAGKLPGFRIGGRLRFRPSEIEAWLEEQRGGRNGRSVSPNPPLARRRGSLRVSPNQKEEP